jgi:uncharacterized protein (TIGR03067 family)
MDKMMVRWCKRSTRGDVTTVTAGPQVVLKVCFVLDRTQSPHAIDYDDVEGGNAEKRQLGIFELAGDVLTICMAPTGQPRPAEFASRPGDGRMLTRWRRTQP